MIDIRIRIKFNLTSRVHKSYSYHSNLVQCIHRVIIILILTKSNMLNKSFILKFFFIIKTPRVLLQKYLCACSYTLFVLISMFNKPTATLYQIDKVKLLHIANGIISGSRCVMSIGLVIQIISDALWTSDFSKLCRIAPKIQLWNTSL